MARRLAAVNPGLVVAGTETPPFTEITEEHLAGLVARVRASGANVLWIGLGTPTPGLPRPPALRRPLDADRAGGRGFRLLGGHRQARPRAFLHGTGLEWLYRLATEPRRLWRRYLLGNPRFLVSAWRHRG